MKKKKKRRTLACRNITMISGTKGDGEVRVLNSREWHERRYTPAEFLPPLAFFFLCFLFIAKVRSQDQRGKRARRHDRVEADEGRTMHTMGVLLED